jgi:hypothetical protein
MNTGNHLPYEMTMSRDRLEELIRKEQSHIDSTLYMEYDTHKREQNRPSKDSQPTNDSLPKTGDTTPTYTGANKGVLNGCIHLNN